MYGMCGVWYVCMYVCMYVCVVCMYVCMYGCMYAWYAWYVCMYVCMCQWLNERIEQKLITAAEVCNVV